MSFTRPSANLTPIENTVFAVVKLAKQAIAELGEEAVVNATIGSLYNEEGQLVALKSVFDHYDEIPHQTKAGYASSITGNESYRKQVWNWLLQGRNLNLAHSVIATPGGSGAVFTTIANILEQGDALVMPDIAWENYQTMAEQNNMKTVCYSMFDQNHFNFESFKNACLQVLEKQNRLLAVINDPCHNPTGYSMSIDEWKKVIRFLNECAKKAPCVLLNDIAYIDYGFDAEHTRDYLETLNQLDDNVLAVIAFSSSKTCTSYGLRCGAAILIGQDQEKVREAEIVYEKTARAMWSNIPNAAMENFTWVTTENREAFMEEKQFYIDLLKKRSTIFVNEARECGLPIYPFKEGFFVTIQIEDDNLKGRYHRALMQEQIYAVQVTKGIRVGICSLSVKKAQGLAARMKKILDNCKEG